VLCAGALHFGRQRQHDTQLSLWAQLTNLPAIRRSSLRHSRYLPTTAAAYKYFSSIIMYIRTDQLRAPRVSSTRVREPRLHQQWLPSFTRLGSHSACRICVRSVSCISLLPKCVCRPVRRASCVTTATDGRKASPRVTRCVA
jgi:hypothetical protein